MKILIIGDVVSKSGRKSLSEKIESICKKFEIDFIIVNVENSASGAGVTKKILDEFIEMNVDVMTSGNHIWDKKGTLEFIDDYPTLLRPHNYPLGTPGSGWVEIKKNKISIGVLNLLGQAFMNPLLDSPYKYADQVLEEKSSHTKVVIVDYHAESTSEKVAMGWYLDGRVSAVIGTHTHIQTADERILPKGTAYITDVGMTGCYDSIIGSEINSVLRRMVHKLPSRLETANGQATVCGVVISVDEISGLSCGIQRIQFKQ